MRSIRAQMIVTCIATLVVATAQAATPSDGGTYRRCVIDRAERLAPANATAGEVAEAALAACEQDLRDVIAASFPGAPSDTVERVVGKLEATARRAAIAVVVVSRMPAKKP